MSKPPDYHIHTRFSSDCLVEMSEMCRAAVDRGLSEIGFTEHLDLDPGDADLPPYRIEAWWEEIERCRHAFKGLLTIRAGIELGEPHRYPKTVQGVLQRFPWDYALGALHWVDSELIFHEAYFQRSAERAYLDYFEELGRMAEAGGFDILAHLDVVKRYAVEHYGRYDPARYEREIRGVLRTCVARGIALEVNTCTLRRPIGEMSPDRTVIDWYREAGGRWVTLGSDAHLAQDVGAGFDRAVATVQAAGFEHLARFERRQPSPLPLPATPASS